MQPSGISPSMIDAFRKRVRISDTIGWHSSNLAVLLPETDRSGAALVANDLVKLGQRHGLQLDSAIYVYPWDDRLISLSNEIADATEPPSDQDDGDGIFGNGDSSNGHQSRVDSSHSPLHLSGLNGHNGNGHLGTHELPQNNVQVNTVGETQNSASVGGNAVATLDFPEHQAGMEAAFHEVVAELSPASVPAGVSLLAPVPEDRPVMAVSAPTPGWKRAIDIVGAGTGLVVLSPILLGAWAAIRLTSKGPALFRQSREGKDGQPFDILKFRTMVIDAEARQAELRDVSEQDGPAFKLKDDPRITAVGRYLRKSCIDELPQLINILRGEMSLVGPRPLPVGESKACGSWQRVRLTVLPGLTCIWQARGGRNVSFDQWMRMDLEYIRTRSLRNDIKLILETAYIALMQRGSV
jgi:lipopolysaccharide/colanic/teichoic acid biosynthesis glycosyltransferase